MHMGGQVGCGHARRMACAGTPAAIGLGGARHSGRTSAHCTLAMCPPRVRSSQLASYSLGPAGRAEEQLGSAATGCEGGSEGGCGQPLQLDWAAPLTHKRSIDQ